MAIELLQVLSVLICNEMSPAAMFRQPERDESFLESLDPLFHHGRGSVMGNPF
jgi:hypothetical protein